MLRELAAKESLRKSNWDGYGADPLTDESVELAKRVEPVIPKAFRECIVPTVDGGLAWEWVENGCTYIVDVWSAQQG